MWQLIFEDQFLSSSSIGSIGSWTTGFPWGQTHWDGDQREPQYYTRFDKNVPTDCNKGGINHVFTGSGLTLLLEWEPGSYEVWSWPNGPMVKTCEPFDYTSAMIYSKARYLYGKFEIRCTIPASGADYFPAFWLYGQDAGHYREIDVFEFADPAPATLITTLHLSPGDDNPNSVPTSSDGDPPLNHFQHKTTLSADVGQYHTYGAVWTPNSVTWLFDEEPVYSLGNGHVPHRDVALIANLAIAPWRTPPAQNQLPAGMAIDYIRVYRNDRREFFFESGGKDQLGSWNLNHGDQFIAANLGGGGTSEVLLVAANGWAFLANWSNGSWAASWNNGGSGLLLWWYLHAGDTFIAGDFDGDGKDEILIIGLNGWSAMLRRTGGSWFEVWDNGGGGNIGGWILNPGDRFFAGDFDGDGKTEILTVALSGWSSAMRWSGGTWDDAWDNGGAGKIQDWTLNHGDQFVAGDFDGDGNAEVLAVAQNGWSMLLKWSGDGWLDAWDNGGGGNIEGWILNQGDRFIAGDFDGDGKSEIVPIALSGWAASLGWMGTGWTTLWENQGAGTIHSWYMHPDDIYYTLKNSGGPNKLAAVSSGGWWQTMRFDFLP